MLIHKGKVYKMAANSPRWVQKLKEAVTPDVYASHRHLLGDVEETQRLISKLLQEHGKVVFDPEDHKLLGQVSQTLERYNYPLALVEVKEEDIFLL